MANLKLKIPIVVRGIDGKQVNKYSTLLKTH